MFGPWGSWGAKAEEPSPAPTRKPGDPMIACIKGHGGRTFCGRLHEANEWVFGDAHHAEACYAEDINRIPLGGLRVCKECVVQARAEWKKEAEGRAK
jgi:hypothetical protein